MTTRIKRGIVVWETVFVYDVEYLVDFIAARSKGEWTHRRKKPINIRKHPGCYWMILE